MPPWPDIRKLPAAELLLALVVFVSAGLAILLTRVPGGTTLFWPAGGIAAAVLLRLPRGRLVTAGTLVLAAAFLSSWLVAQRSWPTALLLTGINGVEVALMVAAFRVVRPYPFPDITITQAVIVTAVSGVAIPGIAALAAGFALRAQLHMDFWVGAEQWWSSHTVGACLFGPPILLFSPTRWRRLVQRRYRLKNAATLLLILLGTYLLIRYVRFPFAGIAMLLLIVAFRVEAFGAALAGLVTGLLIIALWLFGLRPIGLESPTSPGTLLDLPVVAFLATVLPAVAVGIGTDARRNTLRSLKLSERRFRVTVNSISDAVVTLDSAMRIDFINVSAQQLLGLDADAARQRRIDEVMHLTDPHTGKSAASLAAMCALHGQVMRRENPCVLHRPDGMTSYVQDSASPVLDGSGHVTGIVLALRDATAEVERTRDLRHRATYDPLTGVANRSEFQQRLRDAFRRARQLERPAALLAIDLDRFKAVNDAAGHAAGDEVLRQVAAVCRVHVRSSDTVARLGGDEFAMILDNCPEPHIDAVCRKILKALNPLEIEWEGARYAVGASIGVATLTSTMRTESDWLEAADKACYQAKADGRGVLRLAT